VQTKKKEMTSTQTQTKTMLKKKADSGGDNPEKKHSTKKNHRIIYFDASKTHNGGVKKFRRLQTLIDKEPELFSFSDGEVLKKAMLSKDKHRRLSLIRKLNVYSTYYHRSANTSKTFPRYQTTKKLMIKCIQGLTEKHAEQLKSTEAFTKPISETGNYREADLGFHVSTRAVYIVIDALNQFLASILQPTSVVLTSQKKIIAKIPHLLTTCQIYVKANPYSKLTPHIVKVIKRLDAVYQGNGGVLSEFMSVISLDGAEFELSSLFGANSEAMKSISFKCNIHSQSPWNRRFINVMANIFVLILTREAMTVARYQEKKTINASMVEYVLENSLQMKRC
jgi:hypothetical protein